MPPGIQQQRGRRIGEETDPRTQAARRQKDVAGALPDAGAEAAEQQGVQGDGAEIQRNPGAGIAALFLFQLEEDFKKFQHPEKDSGVTDEPTDAEQGKHQGVVEGHDDGDECGKKQQVMAEAFPC